MRLADFDYALPEELIAQEPVTPRDASRLLVLPADGGTACHKVFAELPSLLSPGDLLVMNDTKVIPARLIGKKPSGGKAELLLCESLDERGDGLGRLWRALGQASKALRAGTVLSFGPHLTARLIEAEGEGFYRVELNLEGAALESALEQEGRVPLPPYVRREPTEEDRDRYQTMFARVPGSAAAPTAGLHFTPQVLEALSVRGVRRAAITLHVGPGTFLPVRSEDVTAHRMHAERFFVPDAAAEELAACRGRGGRIVAVGTTTVRTLESAFRDGAVQPGPGRTRLFVRPGHEFRSIDGLVTNFHLPRSTLLMLVCALGGTDRVLGAYAEAVSARYRFFSYGDAMLIWAHR